MSYVAYWSDSVDGLNWPLLVEDCNYRGWKILSSE